MNTLRRVLAILIAFLPAILVYGIIFYLSDQPGLRSDFVLITDKVLRNGAHITEYAVLYMAVAFGFRRMRERVQLRAADILTGAVLVTVIAALSDEYHQLFVPGRNGSIGDLGFDGLGILLGWFVVYAILYGKKEDA